MQQCFSFLIIAWSGSTQGVEWYLPFERTVIKFGQNNTDPEAVGKYHKTAKNVFAGDNGTTVLHF